MCLKMFKLLFTSKLIYIYDCSLREDDESQVWLRIFTLLREYCIFAQWHYSQNDKEEPLKSKEFLLTSSWVFI